MSFFLKFFMKGTLHGTVASSISIAEIIIVDYFNVAAKASKM